MRNRGYGRLRLNASHCRPVKITRNSTTIAVLVRVLILKLVIQPTADATPTTSVMAISIGEKLR